VAKQVFREPLKAECGAAFPSEPAQRHQAWGDWAGFQRQRGQQGGGAVFKPNYPAMSGFAHSGASLTSGAPSFFPFSWRIFNLPH
jgi:hypothetical protein